MTGGITDGSACIGGAGELEATAAVAGWFGHLLLAPMDEAAISAHGSDTMRGFLLELGTSLDQSAAAEALAVFFRDAPFAWTEARMGHIFVLLFEGVAGPDAISLYESAYSGEGTGLYQTPFVEMQAILRELDVAVGGTCREPPDHLALELAALAEALRQGKTDLADHLAARLRGWVPAVARAVAARPGNRPYREIFTLLDAFLALLPSTACVHDTQSASLL